MAAADLLRGGEPVVAAVGGHADVDERDVGPSSVHHPQQRVSVAAAAVDLDPGVFEQSRETVSEEYLVVGDHDAHGNSAHRYPVSAWRVPPAAPTRSSSRVEPAARSP